MSLISFWFIIYTIRNFLVFLFSRDFSSNTFFRFAVIAITITFYDMNSPKLLSGKALSMRMSGWKLKLAERSNLAEQTLPKEEPTKTDWKISPTNENFPRADPRRTFSTKGNVYNANTGAQEISFLPRALCRTCGNSIFRKWNHRLPDIIMSKRDFEKNVSSESFGLGLAAFFFANSMNHSVGEKILK